MKTEPPVQLHAGPTRKERTFPTFNVKGSTETTFPFPTLAIVTANDQFKVQEIDCRNWCLNDYKIARKAQTAAIPAIIVNGKLRVSMATASAIAAAIHSEMFPCTRMTASNAAIKQPGSALKARVHTPVEGNRAPRT